MSALSAARLLGAGAAWRVTGWRAAGRTLVMGLTDPDPDCSMLAGLLLTRAGDRSVPLISEALRAGADPAGLVDVLAGIGTDDARRVLRSATRSARPDLAGAARQALHALDQQRQELRDEP